MVGRLIPARRLKNFQRTVEDYLSTRVRPLLIELLIINIPDWFDQGLKWLTERQLLVLALCLTTFAWPIMTARPTILQQGLVALSLLLVGQVLLRLEDRQTSRRVSEYLHLLMAALSTITTLRYLYYRSNYTLNLDSWLDGFFSLLLFVAELYAIATLLLSYFQTLRIRDRKSIPLTQWPQEKWPTVDIYIPTYNEDVAIVRKTVLGALNTDYPDSKKTIYVLDDGRAEKYRERRLALQKMCDDLGCLMLTRDDNEHAKAGNINTALNKTDGQLVLILDCDHIPVRGFLQETVGFFFDKKVALVQTPHWFYNPDPFERNLLTQGQIPVGNELFYKVLQKGNDFWNAAFFCGSAAVIRRKYLLDIGGIATETVTEDCHTSLRLHSLGYRTVYYDKIMVAGLAPEKFSSYVGQQVRWARGMAQILRIENPLFNRRLNLRLSQRLCYFSATSHFFFGFPRLMYAIAPNLFLLFGINSVKGLGIETLFYALPHIVLSMHANHISYKHVRFSFWNEIYEFAMSFQAGIVTLLALLNPNLGSFNVTDKGVSVESRSFDVDSVRYLVVLGAVTAASLLTVPIWLILSPLDTQAVLINTLWCIFNLALVLAACLVAFEQPQLRQSHRLPRELIVKLYSDDGQEWEGTTLDVSETGAQVLLDVWPNISEQVNLELYGDYGAIALLDAEIIRASATDSLQTKLAVNFVNMNQSQQDDLATVIFSDVRKWYSQDRENSDNPLGSLRFILMSLKRAFQELNPANSVKMRKQVEVMSDLRWKGWGSYVQAAMITELGSRDIRLELLGDASTAAVALQDNHPLLHLQIYPQVDSVQSYDLMAQVERLELIPKLSSSYAGAKANPTLGSPNQLSDYRVALELSFPISLDQQQHNQIKTLLKQVT
ncbi:UDP-forming cellulose synthase catalytic subunit [Leptolyngbya cf. ectocarpi LEGE 11479]|uniref:Cellulose synthase catalytic subunit [UDP-forming] n=1 Tax=Leptolyngbya cf. ectocarpi LEGE 11479 TaxID=1828722 RepID=A0A928ZXE7_LEPEC|nr:UDP-forming cellulose synthase catalytic subunit [Leptolyngbya ectocarpi]MBE9069153.1 UDP-forming cellulose synthase catalytic subunit [Leptolyngbya cf. ectocarpi LEGE 11479]